MKNFKVKKLIVKSATARMLQENDQAYHSTVMKDRGSLQANTEFAREKYLGQKFWIAEPLVNLFSDEKMINVIDYPAVLNPKPETFRVYTVPSCGTRQYNDGSHRFEVEVTDLTVNPVERFSRVASVDLTLKIILKKSIDYVKENKYP